MFCFFPCSSPALHKTHTVSYRENITYTRCQRCQQVYTRSSVFFFFHFFCWRPYSATFHRCRIGCEKAKRLFMKLNKIFIYTFVGCGAKYQRTLPNTRVWLINILHFGLISRWTTMWRRSGIRPIRLGSRVSAECCCWFFIFFILSFLTRCC